MRKENFYPLTYTREAGELRCGATSLAEHPDRKIQFPWELIKHLGEDLEKDIKSKLQTSKSKGTIHPSVVIYSPRDVFVEEGAEVEACAVLDARGGPIYIGRGTVIRPQAYLRGPLSIGPECRIGGEVAHSIFHGYSNKAHYGFIGHSYIGEWVNLGAGTTNSNLKNTYGTVKVSQSFHDSRFTTREIDTGLRFCGCIIGDHAKLGIGTLIPTGAVVGTGACLFDGGMMPKNVKNFSWGEGGKYRFDDFIASAKLVMGRRGMELDENQIKKLKDLFTAA